MLQAQGRPRGRWSTFERPARARIAVKTLESLIFDEKCAKVVVRFAHKTLKLRNQHPKITPVLGIKRNEEIGVPPCYYVLIFSEKPQP